MTKANTTNRTGYKSSIESTAVSTDRAIKPTTKGTSSKMIGNVDINVFGGRIGGTNNSSRRLLSSDNTTKNTNNNSLNSPTKRSLHNPNKKFDKTPSTRRDSLSSNDCNNNSYDDDNSNEFSLSTGKGKDGQPNHHHLLRTQIDRFEKKSLDRDDFSPTKNSKSTSAKPGAKRITGTPFESPTRRPQLSLSRKSDHYESEG